MKERLTNHIKEQRRMRGLTQQELGGAVGVSRQSVISIERGRYVPSLQLALRLARFFDCPIDLLFELKEDW